MKNIKEAYPNTEYTYLTKKMYDIQKWINTAKDIIVMRKKDIPEMN